MPLPFVNVLAKASEMLKIWTSGLMWHKLAVQALPDISNARLSLFSTTGFIFVDNLGGTLVKIYSVNLRQTGRRDLHQQHIYVAVSALSLPREDSSQCAS